MIVTWIGSSPLAIAIGFVLCTDYLAMLIAVGASSWCGASAISAVAPVVMMASSEDVALSITSVVAFFTIIFTFVQPYIASAVVGMPDEVAGAWIGGLVDQTGNAIVSAAILISDEATEVAGIVKMELNAGLGVMASIIACYWSIYQVDAADEGTSPSFSLLVLWDKLPKFTLGFIVTSVLLTVIVLEQLDGTLEQADALPRAISTLNKWWFAIAFCGIGLTTNVSELFKKAWKSGVIQVYLLANTVDIFFVFGFLAYLAYRP